jgi:hypothetical protein
MPLAVRQSMVALVVLAGCAPTVASQVPPARPDAVNLTRYEHWCVDVEGVVKTADLKRAGEEGWELVTSTFRPPVVAAGTSVGGGATTLCFKRPR